MSKWTEKILLAIFLLVAFGLHGQNYLNKKVTLPEEKIALKAAFKLISSQTGCVFSYDPTRIPDNQLIHVSVKSLDLNAALLQILPKDVQYSLKGKYIVLKKIILKKPSTSTSQKTKLLDPGASETKKESRISKNPELERLVLPPLQNSISNTIIEETPVEPNQKPDSIIVAGLDTISVKDSISLAVVKDTVAKIQPESPKSDTTVTRIGFGDFLKKNYYLKGAVLATNQLAGLSIQAGLSNVYAILSVGSDYNSSYLIGLGAGIHLPATKRLSVDVDMLYNSLIAGKSYELQVRASNTQIIPALNFSFTKSIAAFVGPTINLIKSSYVSPVSTTDLGLFVGIGYSFGIKVNLKSLFSKEKS